MSLGATTSHGVVAALCAALVVTMACCSFASGAAAYSDPEVFAWPSEEGGGNGRYFTGSPRDPYACEVCHRGGITPEVELRGLPERFVAGEDYEVTVRFAGADASHALQLELTQRDGQHADLRLPSDGAAAKEQRCDGDPDSIPAFYAVDLKERRVLGVQDCGASELSFSFTAPDADELYFALSMVRSDSSGTAAGDGTLQVRRLLYHRADPLAVAGGGGCAVVAGPGRRDSQPLLIFLLVMTLSLGVSRLRCRGYSKLKDTVAVRSRAYTCCRPTNAR